MMSKITPSKTYFGQFDGQFIEDVHQLLAWGYQDAKTRIHVPLNNKDKQETAITGFIAEAIEDRIDNLNRPDWCIFYSVSDDPPARHATKSGRSRPRSDLTLKSNILGGPKFIFEAKRLKKGSYSVGGYTGAEGMECFVSGKYASRYDEAGMLGYIQSDSLEYWQQTVKKKIATTANELSLIPPQQNIHIIDAFPLEWVSHHQREDVGRDIAIYHILLDCRSQNSPASQ
ncbi:hypothetical protein QUF58_10780 [Anaerolineales bacterium HSG24]|nr:hypothetical protein [Anaerolineales bacterium HSG24]